MVSGRLGIDHNDVLGGRYAFPVMSRYLVQRGGKLHDVYEQNKLLYWYVQSFLWGRFAGSTESVLNQDLRAIEQTDGGLDRLIEQLRLWRGTLEVRPQDFGGWSLGARFYPMLYLLTRVYTQLFASFEGYGANAKKDPIFERADKAARLLHEEMKGRVTIAGSRAFGPIQVWVLRREAGDWQ
jgi:hypothetical protein